MTPDLPNAEADWATGFFDEGFHATFAPLGKFDSTETEVDALVALLRLPAGAQILDVACGFGRHASSLARRGYRVTGLDSSSAQIREARHRHPEGTFIRADMRNPPPGPYDAVLNLWTSFGFFATTENDLAALVAWASVLVPDGVLVMEIDTLERFEHEIRSGSEPVSIRSTQHPGATQYGHYDWSTQIAQIRWSRPGWVRTGRLHMYSRPQLQAALHQAGFTNVAMAGDFHGGPVTSHGRTVITAQRL